MLAIAYESSQRVTKYFVAIIDKSIFTQFSVCFIQERVIGSRERVKLLKLNDASSSQPSSSSSLTFVALKVQTVSPQIVKPS